MTRENLQVELALLLSVLLHAAMFGGWQYRTTLARFPFLRPLVKLVTESSPPAKRVEPPLQTIIFVEVPEPPPEQGRIFMETSGSQVTGEQPKSADYYSDKATVAANPENPTGKTADTPYSEGTETRVMSPETVPFVPPLAAPPVAAAVAPVAPAPRPETLSATAPTQVTEPVKSEPSQPVAAEGLKAPDEKLVAMIAPEFAVPPSPVVPALPPVAPSAAGVSPVPAPASEREIAALKSKLTATGLSREGVTAFNVSASPFGVYDQKIIRAVQSRWYALIERYGIYERAGTVSLNFQLYDDGTLHNLQRTTNSAGEILALYCEKAIVDSAPFDPLPEPLRVLLGKEPRPIEFTFYY